MVPPTWPLPPLSAPWSRPSSRPFKRQDDEREMNLFFSRARHYANWTRRRRSDGASRRRDTFFFTYTPLPSPTNSTMRTSTSHLFCTSHRILRCDILPFSPGAPLALVTRRGIWTPLHLRSVSPAEDPPAWHGIALYPSASLVVDFSLPPSGPLAGSSLPPKFASRVVLILPRPRTGNDGSMRAVDGRRRWRAGQRFRNPSGGQFIDTH